MTRLPLVLLVTLASGLLAACSQLDPEEARICRVALVALAPEGATPTITRQGSAGEPEAMHEVRIDFETDAAVRRHFVQCRFAPHAEGRTRPELVSVRTDAGPLTESGFYFLQRFWLDTADADRADPQPVARSGIVPSVPPTLAYGLQTLLNALPAIATYGMLAAAYSLVYGLVGRINLAFGELAAVGGAGALGGAAFLPSNGTLLLVLVTFATAIWAASLHGLAVSRWVFLPLRGSTSQQGLVATVGLALVLNEYLRLAQGQAPLWIAPLRTAPIAVARSGSFIVTVTPLGIVLPASFLLTAAGVLVLLGRTQFGRNWRAIADDPGAAALMGVSSVRVFTETFVLASALAGASGATVVLVYGSFGTTLGTTLGLKALLAAVLGGIGSVPGAFIGGVVLALVEAGWSAFFPIDYRDLVVFILLAGALIARPGGLFGFADLRPRRV